MIQTLNELWGQYFQFSLEHLFAGIGETLYMTLASTLFAYIIGLPMGILLILCAPDGLWPNKVIFRILNIVTNIFRSVPFLLLIVIITPVTRAIIGTSLGSTATVVALVISAAPFVARLVESSLREVDKGVVEAAISMGAGNGKIVWKVLLGEALPSLINGVTIAMTTILAYSAMAGAIGGGGLGDIAIQYGYYRYDTKTAIICVVLIVILVQIIQVVGNAVSKAMDKRI